MHKLGVDYSLVTVIELRGLAIEVSFKRIKHLHLRVRSPEGRVTVSAPVQMPLAVVQRFVLSKWQWLEKKQAQLAARPRTSSEQLNRQHQRWEQQRQRLKVEVGRLVQHWQPIMQVSVQKVTLRRMKSKWGSCTPAKGTIRINLVLAERSPQVLEMVLVHEMVHLLESSHNARFYALMDRFLPNWRRYQQELDQPNRGV
ncbi:MAG: SprT family zinc-dependent metalloprotease [Gammaproteobacteria bacterium]|nr:SprT family zinc-dependent metalloprotease [Gammaproteobacteria bacterium]